MSNTQLEIKDGEWSWESMTLWEYLEEGNFPSDWTDFFISQSQELHNVSVGISQSIENNKTVYPPIYQVFRAFIHPKKVRVVIIGQDPYFQGSAVGLCFSVLPGNKINPSLRNIYTELKKEGFAPIEDGILIDWVQQGCLLLNTALTVEEKTPDSHTKLWKKFTKNAITHINDTTENVAWLLMGAHAHAFEKFVDVERGHKCFLTTHPSPFSAYKPTKTAPAFIGSGVFKEINAFLPKPILWDRKKPIDEPINNPLWICTLCNCVEGHNPGCEDWNDEVKRQCHICESYRCHWEDCSICDETYCWDHLSRHYSMGTTGQDCCKACEKLPITDGPTFCSVVNVRKANLKKLGYKDFKDWLDDDKNQYVGRRVQYVDGTFNSDWRNTFSAKKYGRVECCAMFAESLRKEPSLRERLAKLKGKTLGCWCVPEQCHAQHLAVLVNSL